MTRDELIEAMARAIDPAAFESLNWFARIGSAANKRTLNRVEAARANATAALAAIEAAGCVVAPKEPTVDQLHAAQMAWLDDPRRQSGTIYRAALAASPLAKDA